MARLAGLQIINKILSTRNYGIVLYNGLTKELFHGYEKEFEFMDNHFKKYQIVPDKETFKDEFPDFDFTDVNESDKYLLDGLYEDEMRKKFVECFPIIEKTFHENSIDAFYMLQDFIKNNQPRRNSIKGHDIIAEARERLELYKKKSQQPTANTISSGFPELDDVLGGWEYGEELVTILGRVCQGKSWFLMKLLAEAWKQGKRVGLYSGEMSHIALGYRFDALFGHHSNRALKKGDDSVGYETYIENLANNGGCFLIITPKQLGGKPTVNKLQQFVEENDLDILGVDQLSLLQDSRAMRNDPIRVKYCHLAEDLFQLSIECKIPVLALAQANRDAAKKKDLAMPEMENFKESDDIPANSSKCISLKQTNHGNNLYIKVIKNREGENGATLKYAWNIDKGYMKYIPKTNDGTNSSINKAQKDKLIQDTNDNTIYNPFS